MKVKYELPITNNNIENLSVSIEEAKNYIEKASYVDKIISPICIILNILSLPLIAIMLLKTFSLNSYVAPMKNIAVLSFYLDKANSIMISLLGSALPQVLIVFIIAIIIPSLICFPISIIIKKIKKLAIISPLEGETSITMRAKLLCDQVESLRFSRSKTMKDKWFTLLSVIMMLLFAAYCFYLYRNVPNFSAADNEFIFISCIGCVVFGIISYLLTDFSKSLVTKVCNLKPKYNVKKLRKYAYDYRMSVDMPLILRTAIENNSFYINYQPIYWLEENKFYSSEALARLEHPLFGNISPALFIECAERTGQIKEFTDIILHQVCKFVSSSDFRRLNMKYVNINLSVSDVNTMERASEIVSIIDAYGISHKRIGFEITETGAIESEEGLLKVLDYLAFSGFTINMDDFGTGYSSLSRIISDSFSVIKLDRTLIADKKDSNRRTLLVDIVKMLKHLDKEIVMEGVETKEQRDLMKELNIEHIQGYFYSKPLSEENFIAFVEEQNADVN